MKYHSNYVAESILSNFKINTPLKFILYVSAIIFIGSLFVNIKGYDLARLQYISLRIIILGVIFWFIKELLETVSGVMDKHSEWLSVMAVFYYLCDIAYIIGSILFLI
jgi:hypothetical protein